MNKFGFVLFVSTLAGSLGAEAQTSMTAREADLLERGRISTGQYVTGGVLGSVLLPFGIGQAIQGRYGEAGWKFTLGEVGSLTMLVVATNMSRPVYSSYYAYESGSSAATTTLMLVGAAGFVAFRIWEIVDLWVGPPAHNRAYARALEKSRAPREVSFAPMTLSPTGLAPGGSVTLRF